MQQPQSLLELLDLDIQQCGNFVSIRIKGDSYFEEDILKSYFEEEENQRSLKSCEHLRICIVNASDSSILEVILPYLHETVMPQLRRVDFQCDPFLYNSHYIRLMTFLTSDMPFLSQITIDADYENIPINTSNPKVEKLDIFVSSLEQFNLSLNAFPNLLSLTIQVNEPLNYEKMLRMIVNEIPQLEQLSISVSKYSVQDGTIMSFKHLRELKSLTKIKIEGLIRFQLISDLPLHQMQRIEEVYLSIINPLPFISQFKRINLKIIYLQERLSTRFSNEFNILSIEYDEITEICPEKVKEFRFGYESSPSESSLYSDLLILQKLAVKIPNLKINFAEISTQIFSKTIFDMIAKLCSECDSNQILNIIVSKSPKLFFLDLAVSLSRHPNISELRFNSIYLKQMLLKRCKFIIKSEINDEYPIYLLVASSSAPLFNDFYFRVEKFYTYQNRNLSSLYRSIKCVQYDYSCTLRNTYLERSLISFLDKNNLMILNLKYCEFTFSQIINFECWFKQLHSISFQIRTIFEMDFELYEKHELSVRSTPSMQLTLNILNNTDTMKILESFPKHSFKNTQILVDYEKNILPSFKEEFVIKSLIFNSDFNFFIKIIPICQRYNNLIRDTRSQQSILFTEFSLEIEIERIKLFAFFRDFAVFLFNYPLLAYIDLQY